MRQISQLRFLRKYDIDDPDVLVKSGEKRFITDDFYLIRSTTKIRDYASYHEIVFKEIPVFKLLSLKSDAYQASINKPQLSLITWNNKGHSMVRRTLFSDSIPGLTSRYPSNNAIFDMLHYLIEPLVLRHGNGNLLRGFKNHLLTRIYGFGEESIHTITILNELRKELENEQGSDDILYKMRTYLDNCMRLEQCPVTGIISTPPHMLYANISGNRCHIARGIDLEEHGYTEDGGIWLKENEIMIDGTCYDSRTVKIIRCSSCNIKCVEEETKDGECVDCCGRDYRVHNYSHKVEETLGFDKDNKETNEPYLGIELEYQVDRYKSGRLYTGNKLQGHALMKDDGSIRHGFEIVTRPAGYWTHVMKLSSFLDDLPNNIKPHESCGMHVHISRSAFTFLGAGKFTEFFNRPENADFVKLIAGRGSTQYQKRDTSMDIKTPYLQVIRDYSVNRYNFVNINNKKTIELRIFATPADKMEFMIRMQFVKAMIEYCKPAQHSVSLKRQTHYESFCNWLNNKRNNSYEILNNFIKESTVMA